MASMEPLLICCLMAHNSRKNGSPTVSCEHQGVRGQDLVSPLSPSGFQPPSSGLLVSPILPPKEADTHTDSRVPPLPPSHTPRDQPLSLKLREGKYTAQKCTEGTSRVGLDPWTPMPETEPFYKVGACGGIAEWKQAQDEASRKPKLDASMECQPIQASHPTSCHVHCHHCIPKLALPTTLE